MKMAPKRALVVKSVWDEDLIREFMKEIHFIKYYLWLIHDNGASGTHASAPFASMGFPKDVIENVKANFVLSTSKVVERIESVRGDTTKLLIELQDGHRVETVVMRHHHHATVCVSSQVRHEISNVMSLCVFLLGGKATLIFLIPSSSILSQFV